MLREKLEILHPFEREAFEVNPETGCWDWKRKLDHRGYPHGYAHRRFYRKLVGPIPKGHHIHHQCGNTACVNPEHLEPLTPTEHFKHHHLDEAGRSLEQVEEVRADRATGLTYHEIARQHGLSYTTVYEWCNVAWDGEGVVLPDRPCQGAGCDEMIPGARANQMFCSPRCRAAASRARRRSGVPLPTDDQILAALARATAGGLWVKSSEVDVPGSSGAIWTGRQLKRLAQEGRCACHYHQRRQVNLYRSTEANRVAA